MRRIKRSYLVIAALAFAAGVAVTTWLIIRPTYADELKRCEKAVAAYNFEAAPVAEGDTIPGCEGIDRDDYLALTGNKAMGDLGWLDEDGRFDKSKMLEDALDD